MTRATLVSLGIFALVVRAAPTARAAASPEACASAKRKSAAAGGARGQRPIRALTSTSLGNRSYRLLPTQIGRRHPMKA